MATTRSKPHHRISAPTNLLFSFVGFPTRWTRREPMLRRRFGGITLQSTHYACRTHYAQCIDYDDPEYQVVWEVAWVYLQANQIAI